MQNEIRLIVVLVATSLLGCPEDKQPTEAAGDDAPTAVITSPTSSSEILDTAVVTVQATDDKGLVKVEVYVDDILNATLTVFPYSFAWDASALPDSSVHLIYAKAYDADDNVSSSPVLTVVVYRFSPSALSAIALSDSVVTLSWQDNSRKETGFEVEQSVNGSAYNLVKTVGADIITTLVTVANPTTSNVFFRIRAISGTIASRYSNVANVQAPPPLTSSSTLVNIVPGTSETVQISGGIPPYHITQYPLAQVATVSFEDSTVSPANLVIHVMTTAIIGNNTLVSVDDSDPNNGDPVSISIIVVPMVISFSDDIQPIFDGNCQNRGCHPGGGAPFSLNRFVSYGNLYYYVVSNASCGAVYRVLPFSPDSSVLYLRVSGRTSCDRMPFSSIQGDTLSLTDQDKIRDWIAQGAQNN